MERVDRLEDLLHRSGDDPWARWSLPRELEGEVWVHQDVALVDRPGRRRGLWVLPLPWVAPQVAVSPGSAEERERVRSALVAFRDGGHLERLGTDSLSVVQEHADAADEVVELLDGGRWDWMWTTTPPPPHPRESEVVLLDDARDGAEILAFSQAHNPRVWTEIGVGRVERWVALRDEVGALVAVGGAEREDSGVAHLAGIVTDSRLRGRGLAGVVTAHLTRWAVAERGACTLGMFSDNDAARRVYARLGYRTAHAWHSRGLAARAAGSTHAGG